VIGTTQYSTCYYFLTLFFPFWFSLRRFSLLILCFVSCLQDIAHLVLIEVSKHLDLLKGGNGVDSKSQNVCSLFFKINLKSSLIREAKSR
jgi:hypothetical protein